MTVVDEYTISLKEAASKLGCSSNSIRRFVAAGLLKACKVGPARELRFRQEDLDSFQASVDIESTTQQLNQCIGIVRKNYSAMHGLTKK